MLRHAWKINFQLRSNFQLFNSKRFKGHSHWQNVRHVKTTNDNKRSLQITMYMRKMQGIINSKNGDTNPETNTGLANVLEQAKKENLPVTTLQNFLKKLSERDFVPQQIFLRGEEHYVIGVTYDKKRQQFFRQALKKACRDYKVAMQEIPNIDNIFTTKGIIVSKAPSKGITFEEAEEVAIVAGAEDVEEIESADKEEKVFQFITLQEDLWTAVKYMKEQGWYIYEQKHELVPLYCVELPEEKMSQLHDFVTALEEIPEVTKVVVNIA